MVYGSPRWTTTTGPSVLWFSAWGRRCGKSAQKVCTCDNEGGRNTEDGVNSTRAHSFLLTIPSEKHEQLSSRLVLLVSHRALHSASTRVAKMRVMVAEVPPAQRRLKRACLLLGDHVPPTEEKTHLWDLRDGCGRRDSSHEAGTLGWLGSRSIPDLPRAPFPLHQSQPAALGQGCGENGKQLLTACRAARGAQTTRQSCDSRARSPRSPRRLRLRNHCGDGKLRALPAREGTTVGWNPGLGPCGPCCWARPSGGLLGPKPYRQTRPPWGGEEQESLFQPFFPQGAQRRSPNAHRAVLLYLQALSWPFCQGDVGLLGAPPGPPARGSARFPGDWSPPFLSPPCVSHVPAAQASSRNWKEIVPCLVSGALSKLFFLFLFPCFLS